MTADREPTAASVPEHLLGAEADVSPPGVGHAPDSGAALSMDGTSSMRQCAAASVSEALATDYPLLEPTATAIIGRVVVEEETGKERAIIRGCFRCGVTPDFEYHEILVSPGGIAHYQDETGFEKTKCGINAARDGWLWPL